MLQNLFLSLFFCFLKKFGWKEKKDQEKQKVSDVMQPSDRVQQLEIYFFDEMETGWLETVGIGTKFEEFFAEFQLLE